VVKRNKRAKAASAPAAAARHPKSAVVPPAPSRNPKAEGDLVVGEDLTLGELRPCFDFSKLDRGHEGSWDWNLSSAEHQTFLDFLRDMQALRWNEIFRQAAGGHKKHHYQAADTLCRQAQDRLAELGLDLQEELFRFRLAGTVRVWGVFIGASHQFFLLWWDRDHQVYPTGK